MCVSVHARAEGWEGGGRGDLGSLLVTCMLSLSEERIFVTFANTIACQSFMFSASYIVRHITVSWFPGSEERFKKGREIYPSTSK